MKIAHFEQHRPLLFSIAYRMLGTVTDAEDMLQEAYLRVRSQPDETIEKPQAYLTTVVTRLCLNHLNLARHQRESYLGPWLPEPLVDGTDDAVGDRVTLDDSVRMGLLVVLDRLTPAERASFILHDVFALSFDEVGEIVGRSAPACRQLAVRARRKIRDDPGAVRPPADASEHLRLAERFAAACRDGDLDGLLDLLAPDALGDFDSGGLVPGAPLVELDGAEAIARQLVASVSPLRAVFRVARVNGEPGVVISVPGQTLAVVALGVRDGQIDLVHAIGNPNKLTHLQPG